MVLFSQPYQASKDLLVFSSPEHTAKNGEFNRTQIGTARSKHATGQAKVIWTDGERNCNDCNHLSYSNAQGTKDGEDDC